MLSCIYVCSSRLPQNSKVTLVWVLGREIDNEMMCYSIPSSTSLRTLQNYEKSQWNVYSVYLHMTQCDLIAWLS